jgi:transposase InsO family protein
MSAISWSSPSSIALGRVNQLPQTIEWLSDNDSGYTAHETRRALPATSGWSRAQRQLKARNPQMSLTRALCDVVVG